MKQLSIFAASLLQSNAPAALPTRSTRAMPPVISGAAAVAIKIFCLTFFVILAAAVGRAQSTASTDGWVVLPLGEYTALRHARLGTTLQLGSVSASVEVTNGAADNARESRRLEEQVKKQQAAQLNAPSSNVFSLQRRVAGILPVRVDVPRSGKSYRFVRPLVLEEETKITFQYKSK